MLSIGKRIFSFILTFIFVAISSLSCAEKDEPTPDGFVWQKLELTGGKILKPSGWFFSEMHKPPEGEVRYFRWIVSKENAAENKGVYDTGVAVNLMFGFKQQTGISSNQMVRRFVSQLESVGKVISYKQPDKIPDQRKVLCVETIEEKNGKKYYVLYSFNWWDDDDFLFYSSAGSLDKEWCKYEKIFNTITQAIDIIDLDNMQRSKK